ncbi:MAG TPA: thermosome subunit alpha [Nitrososphaeraceae archaeon]|nr:thermosome subunit alpha [Nitrososphaeraceae archaeon]
MQNRQLFGEGVRRSSGGKARRYNLLAARLIADLVKGSLGPLGLEKMFIDIMGETTVTKDGATFLRKIDVEHPAAKLLIEASNAVDNAVGDGTTSVVVLAGALVEKAEELLDMGIPPTIISDGYLNALDMAIEILRAISVESINSDRKIMESLASTCLTSKAISHITEEMKIVRLIVNSICQIANFSNNYVDVDDIKIEEKMGSISETELINGIVIDKTIDNSSMPHIVENARVLLLDIDIENEQTRADAQISISVPSDLGRYLEYGTNNTLEKIKNVVDSGANVIFSRGGISPLAQNYFAKKSIMTVRRVKENDLLWLEKATGARITRDLDRITSDDIGFAAEVCQKFVGDDKMVFVDGCKNPKSVTLLLRASSKVILDEFHRAVLDCLYVLRDFVAMPRIVAGGGAAEAVISHLVKERSYLISGKEQIVIQKFSEAVEEIPLTIAINAGMDRVDTMTRLREKVSSQCDVKNEKSRKRAHRDDNNYHSYGVNAIERKIDNMMSKRVMEPLMVKEQIFNTAVEIITLLIRVDDVLIAKPVMDTHAHTHADGTSHSHRDGNKAHDHFDRLGKQQRPMHHYY